MKICKSNSVSYSSISYSQKSEFRSLFNTYLVWQNFRNDFPTGCLFHKGLWPVAQMTWLLHNDWLHCSLCSVQVHTKKITLYNHNYCISVTQEREYSVQAYHNYSYSFPYCTISQCALAQHFPQVQLFAFCPILVLSSTYPLALNMFPINDHPTAEPSQWWECGDE